MSGARRQFQLALELLRERPLFGQHFLEERLPEWPVAFERAPLPLDTDVDRRALEDHGLTFWT